VVARSLRRGKTHTIGTILPDSANPYFAEVVRGIEDTSFTQGYSVILCNSDNDLEKERLYANVLLEKQVDGIIFVPAGLSRENINHLQARGVPLVLVDRCVSEVKADYVLTDNQGGALMAVRHLVDRGHHAIACIAGPEGVGLSSERIAGYKQALAEAGIAFQPEFIQQGDFQYQSGYDAAQKLFGSQPEPTAIFACNDLMAIGAFRYAYEVDLHIPDQLSIVGFDDVWLAAYANPPLTTIRQSKHKMGTLAVKMLIERMADPDLSPRLKVLDTRLIIRQSTAELLQPVGEMSL
jgi:LacI family transcriptional regulator